MERAVGESLAQVKSRSQVIENLIRRFQAQELNDIASGKWLQPTNKERRRFEYQQKLHFTLKGGPRRFEFTTELRAAVQRFDPTINCARIQETDNWDKMDLGDGSRIGSMERALRRQHMDYFRADYQAEVKRDGGSNESDFMRILSFMVIDGRKLLIGRSFTGVKRIKRTIITVEGISHILHVRPCEWVLRPVSVAQMDGTMYLIRHMHTYRDGL